MTMAGHRNYEIVKRDMCTGPVCVMGWFASGDDIETTGPVEIVNRQRSRHVTVPHM